MGASSAVRTIETLRFGVLDVDASAILNFVTPILGFEGLKEFVILDHEPDSPFNWMQSMQDPNLAFVITNPAYFDIAYEFVLPEDACTLLNVQQPDEVVVYTLVTIPDEAPMKMTTNLLGPIVIHSGTNQAMQVILNDNKKFQTKVRLLSDDALDELPAFQDEASSS
jgi:flagellar assembly factor FliW